ncbi:MAG: hypothetical protein PUB69_06215 [Desulfovibrionaceae bacterium]|nr:hypothetical protein [Desulfovibrionaceae bacterium]
MRLIIRLLCLLCVWCFLALSAAAASPLPSSASESIESLIRIASSSTEEPSAEAVIPLLEIVLGGTSYALPSGSYGKGVLLRSKVRVPLRTAASLMLNPSLPGETLYPAVVRRSAWIAGKSALGNLSRQLSSGEWPKAMQVARAREFEETTPDTNSGGYYRYNLDRMFIAVSAEDGSRVLFSISAMNKPSALGLRGAVVGQDANWCYMYTPKVGVNLPMLQWTETMLYKSASVTAFIERANQPGVTEICTFKWMKAGWSGINVVKESHIAGGVQRFFTCMQQALESPKFPNASQIIRKRATLMETDSQELIKRFAVFADYLKKQSTSDSTLKQKVFQDLLQDPQGYGSHMKKEEIVADLMKLYIRDCIGILPAELKPAVQ